MWTERHSAAECNVRPAGSNELLTKTSRLDIEPLAKKIGEFLIKKVSKKKAKEALVHATTGSSGGATPFSSLQHLLSSIK